MTFRGQDIGDVLAVGGGARAPSRRPRASPTRSSDDVKQQAIGVCAALESSGRDHGPIGVHDKMRSLGMDAPSVASLARIFRDAGVARAEPKKKPRASHRRLCIRRRTGAGSSTRPSMSWPADERA